MTDTITLLAGQLVQHSLTRDFGTVLEAGPYGDEPFQVRDDGGRHHSFIREDGTSPYAPGRWLPLFPVTAENPSGIPHRE